MEIYSSHINRYKKDDFTFCNFYLDRKSISECAKQNSKNLNFNVDLFSERLVFSSTSLLEFIRKFEKDIVILNEALIKTYPLKFLARSIVKVLCDEFKIDNCLFKTSEKPKSIELFDVGIGKNVKMLNASEKSFSSTMILKVMKPSSNMDVPKLVAFKFTSKKIKHPATISENGLENLIHSGIALGYDYIVHAFKIDSEKKTTSLILQFEAKNFEPELEVEDFLYHVAPLSLKDRILKFGLSPKSKSFTNSGDKYCHPDRVYLFNGYNEKNSFSISQCTSKKIFKMDWQKT